MNYAEVAQREQVTWCQGGDDFDHRHGEVEPSRGIVHWADRRFTRMGLRRFLMLVASIRYSHNRGQPGWQVLYEQNAFAYHRGMEAYHHRFPRRWSITDRARVRYWMGRQNVLDDHPAIARWAIERNHT